MSTPVEQSNQKSKVNVVSPSVVPTESADKAVNKPATESPPVGAHVKTVDTPMHAAKGNDDIMSQPQANQTGKKKS